MLVYYIYGNKSEELVDVHVHPNMQRQLLEQKF